MDFQEPSLENYILGHTEPESEILYRIYRETHLELAYPQMLSGHLQGRLLSSISRMLKPRRILEIGTFTGYSSICLAEGLQEGGILDSIEKNQELEERVLGYWKEAKLTNCCRLHIGDAFTVMESLSETYDLVFLDADKENYGRYLDPILRLTRQGSWILADNALWSGKVVDGRDAESAGIRAFNDRVHNDTAMRNVLLPVRDGLMLVERI